MLGGLDTSMQPAAGEYAHAGSSRLPFLRFSGLLPIAHRGGMCEFGEYSLDGITDSPMKLTARLLAAGEQFSDSAGVIPEGVVHA